MADQSQQVTGLEKATALLLSLGVESSSRVLQYLGEAEMERLLLANIPAADSDLGALANQRAESVQRWLVEEGKVDPERVFLVPAKAGQAAPAGGQVMFNLH